MSIYVRELLIELQFGALDIDTRVDLLSGLEDLYNINEIAYTDILILNQYLEGYSLEEIAPWISKDGWHPQVDARFVKESLLMTLAKLEDKTKYVDDIIIQHGLNLFPKHRKNKQRFENNCIRLSGEL